MNEKLKSYFELKKQNVVTEEEKNKIIILNNFFSEPDCFFRIDQKTACGILKFLGVPEKEIVPLYLELISPASFSKNCLKVRNII